MHHKSVMYFVLGCLILPLFLHAQTEAAAASVPPGGPAAASAPTEEPAGNPPPAGESSSSSASSVFAAPELYTPITANERVQWYLRGTGMSAIGGSVFSAAWSTAWRSPREYPETWGGFGKRYALSISGIAISNGVEAGLGAAWGEDPTYYRKGGPLRGNLKARAGHVLLSTVTATDRHGHAMPAYSRFIAIPSSSFLQNAWRVESQSSANDALLRTLYGFLGRAAGNAFLEFLPDLRRKKAKP